MQKDVKDQIIGGLSDGDTIEDSLQMSNLMLLATVKVERQPKRNVLKSTILMRLLLPSESHSKHHYSLNKQSAQGAGPPSQRRKKLLSSI